MTALRACFAFALLGSVLGHEACLSSLLPFDLDLISIVERVDESEVHLTGEYRLEEGAPGEVYNNVTGLVEHRLKINELKEDGYLRLSVSHRWGVEMKVILLDDSENERKTAGFNEIERALSATLLKGEKYEILFMYRTIGHHHCPTVNLELAFKYKKNFFDTECEDHSTSKLDLDIVTQLSSAIPSPLDPKTHEFNEITDMESLQFLQVVDGSLDLNALAESETTDYFLNVGKDGRQYIPISLPHLRGMRSEWLLKISLSTDFLLGGGINAVVTPFSFKYDECGEVPIEDCIANLPGAFIATGKRGWWKNTMFLQTLLTSRTATDFDTVIQSKYKLWFYARKSDPPVDKSCPQYSIRVALSPVAEEEDPINCGTVPLPAYLNNQPGYYDEVAQTLHVFQRVGIDRDTGVQYTHIRPVADSLLRVYIEHPTTGIEIILKNNETGAIHATAKTFDGHPKGLVYSLDADVTYGLYFTESQNVFTPDIEVNEWVPFCDGFLARIEVMPVSKITPPEVDVPAAPSSEGLNFSKLLEQPYTMNFTSVSGHQRDGSGVEFSFSKPLTEPYWEQQQIASWDFTITNPSAFRLTIERDFLQGDVVAILYPITINDTSATYDEIFSTNDLRTTQLDADLGQGLYRLTLHTGYVQDTNIADVTSHPHQVEYSMDLFISPLHSGTTSCEGSRPLPDQLQLKHNVVKHIFEVFTVPRHNKHSILLAPEEDGLLHVQISDTKVPIYAEMWEKNGGEWEKLEVKPTQQEDMPDSSGDATPPPIIEELYEGLPWMMFKFKKNKEYILLLGFEETTMDCQTFVMQLSTSHLQDAGEAIGEDCIQKLPDKDMFLGMAMPFHLEEIYTYREDKTIPHTHLNFTLDVPTEFKAVVNYNFKYQHIYLDVCSCPDDSFEKCYDCGSIRGKAMFNGEEIRTQLLPKGHYILKVYESEITAVVNRKLCEQFTLHLWMDSLSRPGKDALPGHNCSHQYLAKDLNVAGMLEHNTFHAMGDIRLDDARRADKTTFTVTESVVFRLWVPPSYSVTDIEIYMHLTKITDDADWTDLLTKEGETMLAKLSKGTYSMFLYYKFVGVTMPGDSDGLYHKTSLPCVSTPVEVSIMPTATYKSENLGESCAPYSEFPSEFPVHGHEARRRPTSALMNEHIKFSFGEKGGRVEFDLRSTFETGSMHMHIMKQEVEGKQEEWAHYYPVRYLDRDYLYTTLGEGEYMVMILNTTDDTKAADGNDNPYSGCQKYSLHMSVEDLGVVRTIEPDAPPDTTVAPERIVDCPLNPVFPDGVVIEALEEMVLLKGEAYSFLQTEELMDMPLRIFSDRLVRIWTHTHNTNIDVDLVVYGPTGEVMVEKIVKSTHVEATLVNLPGNDEPYSVQVRIPVEDRIKWLERTEYKDCDEYNDLTTFDFAVGEMTSEQVAKATQCGEYDKIHDVTIRGELTESKILSFRKNNVDEAMQMKVVVSDGVEEARIVVSARFNFVLMSLRIALFDETTGEMIAVSAAELDVNAEEKYSAETVLTTSTIPPGNYILMFQLQDVDAITSNRAISGGDYCLPFSLNLLASGVKTGVPTYSFTPVSATDLLPFEPLVITIEFSEPPQSLTLTDFVSVHCDCKPDSAACSKAGDTSFKLKFIGDDWHGPQTVDVLFEEPGLHKHSMRWGSTCRVSFEESIVKSEGSGEVFVPLSECDNVACVYEVVEGACVDGACYSGGLCGGKLKGKCAFICQKVEGDTDYPLPDNDGVCPVTPSPPRTPMPTSEPLTLAPINTAVPTPAPTPVPTPIPTDAPTPMPTPVPTPAPTPLPSHATVPQTSSPKTPNTPFPTIDEEKGGGISAGLVIVILIVVCAAVAAVYTAWKKGYIATNKYRNPYGGVDTEFEDDEDLFEDEEDGDEHVMADVSERPEV